MAERQISAKEILFREGDKAEEAYVIRQGSIEILKHTEGGEVRLAELAAGDIVGEMALFDDQHTHSATARAMSDCVVDSITGDEVQAALDQCPPQLVPVILSIFKRLRATNQRVADREPAVAVLGSDVEKIIVSPDSDAVSASMEGALEFPITHLPYRIGGYQKLDEKGKLNKNNHLNLGCEGPPLAISASHCEVIQQDDGLYVLDLGSRYGTTVNGINIGRGRGVYKAPLQKGENSLVFGDKKTSPYLMKITCS